MVLAPSAAEIVFSLGASVRVVGVSDFAKDLPEANGKPRLGGFRPDIERVLALRPDLVIVSRDGTDRAAYEKLRALSLPVLVTQGTTIEGVFLDIISVGTAIGEAARARELNTSLRARLAAARQKSRSIQAKRRFPRVLVVIWPDPPVVAGPASFIGDLLEKGDIPSAVPGNSGEWPRVSLETLALWDPGVIVHPETEENREVFKMTLLGNPHWKLVTALKRGNVLSIPGGALERPGPRLIEALEQLIDGLSRMDR